MRGVFSLQEVRKVGTGTTTRKTVMKTYWFVDQEDDTGNITIQSLNQNYIPTGTTRVITREELIEKYSPEMEFYVSTVFPKIREMNETIDTADEHREKNEVFSAEFEYENALALDEDNVRANFGIGLTYLAQGDNEKADSIFKRLVTLEAAFQKEHKHLFNDFGINLRKSKMYDSAVEFYGRALELGSEDENLFLNIARVYIEKKEYLKALEEIHKSLKLSPDNQIASKMIQWLTAKGFVTQEQVDTAMSVVEEE